MKAPLPRTGLEEAWAALARRALASEDGSADELLEALALASAVDLVPGALDVVPAADRRKLAARGAALLLSSRADGDSDEAIARSRAFALARDGLTVLRGARKAGPETTDATAPTGLPAPAHLRRLLVGGLDGFAAAELGRRIRASPASRSELVLLATHAPSGSPLRLDSPPTDGSAPARAPAERPSSELPARIRLVADDTAGVRDPSGGELVGSARSGSVELEAVRFPDGVVALYAAPARRISVPVLPTGVKIVRTALGYVELDAKKARTKEVDVAVGSHRVTISIR